MDEGMAEGKLPLLLRLHGIAHESVVDGPGLRYAVFVQGCPHHCQGCHNPASHDPMGGYAADPHRLLAEMAENPLLSGLTLSGGEPFAQPVPLAWLAERAKAMGKSVVTYTGYTLAQLQAMPGKDVKRLLAATDMLIDGPFRQDLRDAELRFRGSSNQRVWRKKNGEFVLSSDL